MASELAPELAPDPGVPGAPQMQLKWLVMQKMKDSSTHRGEGPRRGLGTGLPGRIGVPATPGGDMAPLLSLGSEAKRDSSGASLNRSRHSGEGDRKKTSMKVRGSKLKAYFLNL